MESNHNFKEVNSEENKKLQKEAKRKEILTNNLIANASKTLRKLNESSKTPYSFSYFSHLLKRTYVDLKEIEKPTDYKTVGTYCVMVPEEILLALKCLPIKLCSGTYMGAAEGEQVTPRDACPLVKAILGERKMGLIPAGNDCAAYIIPTSCDCKRKLVNELSNYENVYPIHISTLREKDEQINHFKDDLKELITYIENLTNTKLTYKNLMSAINDVSLVQKELYRFIKFQRSNPSIISGTQVIATINSYSFDMPIRWAKALEILNDELEEKLRNEQFISRKNTPRIMIIGSPIIFPNLKVPMLIEDSGGIVVADETCVGSRWMYDPVVVTDKSMDSMLRSIATRYIVPCTCPTFVDNEQRVFKVKQMVEDYQIDGVIYHVLRGCLPYDFEVSIIEDELNKIDIPSIRIETDYNEEDIEQLRIRFEAFIELIKYKNE